LLPDRRQLRHPQASKICADGRHRVGRSTAHLRLLAVEGFFATPISGGFPRGVFRPSSNCRPPSIVSRNRWRFSRAAAHASDLEPTRCITGRYVGGFARLAWLQPTVLHAWSGHMRRSASEPTVGGAARRRSEVISTHHTRATTAAHALRARGGATALEAAGQQPPPRCVNRE
jgi:hypothetical protein